MYNRMLFNIKTILVLSFFISIPAVAGIVITGTRVIYPAGEREVTVKIDNAGDKPVLVQSWIDKGDPGASPEILDVPFTITPPVSRINEGNGHSLRVMYTGTSLPADKESLFWLNVLEIPAVKKERQNKLQMAFRSRLKIFYRPKGLAGSANDAGQSVTWQRVQDGIEGRNPTPYYVSFSGISEDKDGHVTVSSGGMIAPHGKSVFPLKKKVSKFYVSYINDYGGITLVPQSVG